MMLMSQLVLSILKTDRLVTHQKNPCRGRDISRNPFHIPMFMFTTLESGGQLAFLSLSGTNGDDRDTVSSIGITREKYNLARTIEGMKHVCYFRQALALDERRVKFLATPKENPTSAENMQENLSGDSPPQTLEAWFPGTHSDM